MNQQSSAGIRTIEEARERVFAMVAEICNDESCPIQSVLDRCVSEAVAARWENPVKTYVPLLAFREVQQCIRQGYCPDSRVEAAV
jgi:hypothetical protein